MLKKFLTCLFMLAILTCASTAAAKPAELTGINAFAPDNETLRIEISYRGGKLFDDNISVDESSGIVRVDLDNTLPGRISRSSGTQIQSDVKEAVEKITVNKTKDRHTRIQIFLTSEPEDVEVSLEPADSAAKKDACIVIDVKNVRLEHVSTSDVPRLRDRINGYNKNFNGSGHVVVIDPGHGGSDNGAIGPTGVSEKSVSLAVSLKAQKLLSAQGYRVVMTRTTDIDVAAPGVPDGVELQARVDKAPPNAEIFISVHCNAFSNSNANGMETFHAPTAVQGRRLATLLNEELERLGGLNNRGVKSARFYVMTHSKCAASLIELGFVTNPREERLLADSDYQQKLAQAIANAVNRYFN